MSSTVHVTCPCGTFAIGFCSECGAAICGDHSGLIEGRRLCTNDWRVVRATQVEQQEADAQAQRTASAQAEAERRAAWQRALDKIDTERRRLNVQGNPGAMRKKAYAERMRGQRVVQAWKVLDVQWTGAAGNGSRGDQSAHMASAELFLTTDGHFAMYNGLNRLCEWGVDQDAISNGGFVIRDEHLAGTAETLGRLGRP